MAILTLSHVTMAYGANTAVSDVSFEVEAGDYFCVVGPNGSGKSTLIKGILGLVPISKGSVTLGVERAEVGYVPQTRMIPPDFPATAKEIVLTGTQRSTFYSREDHAMAERSLSQMNILNIAQARIGELSGGQQQRVYIARALAKAPKLLVLDEPFAGLDEDCAHGLYKTLSQLNAQGVTLMMVSHDLCAMRRHARRVAVLNRTLQYCGDMAAQDGGVQ